MHDVGVRGYLPRVNKTAIVSRFNPTLRPASRYMHMASIAKVGDRCGPSSVTLHVGHQARLLRLLRERERERRSTGSSAKPAGAESWGEWARCRFVAAWQASKTYEGYADQRIWHTFSVRPSSLRDTLPPTLCSELPRPLCSHPQKDETGHSWGPQRTIPMMDVGRVQWSPVLYMDQEAGKLMLFYSESRLCPRSKSLAEQEATVPPPPPPGLQPGDDPSRWVPGGDIKMVTLDIGVEAAHGRNYSWLRAVRWSQPQTLLSTIEADGNPVPKVRRRTQMTLITGRKEA